MIVASPLNGGVQLRRGKELVSDIFSAIGDVRETRLTAALGFLIAKAPHAFGRMFLNGSSIIEEVSIEEPEDHSRYDVVIRTSTKLIIVEAKVGYLQAPFQIRRYVRALRKQEGKRTFLYLLDQGSERLQTEIEQIRKEFPKCLVYPKTWAEIGIVIDRECRSKKLQRTAPQVVAIGQELVKHLKENQMAESNGKEVYIRQLSGDSLELFFRYQIYKCQSKFAKSALQHLYFAPLFTARAPRDFAARSMLPIEKGLSYFARIERGRVVRRNQVLEYLKAAGHRDPRHAASEILRQTKMKEFLVLVLGEIYQLFQTPLSSRKLGVKGMLSQKTATFQELFAVARKGV